MSLYADYVKERAGRQCHENEHGFMVFEYTEQECFIHDAYVKPDSRLKGEGARMLGVVEKLAKEHGCSMITCTVCPTAKGSTEAMIAILSAGFKLSASATNLIALKKEI